jgi:hypothetical protein
MIYHMLMHILSMFIFQIKNIYKNLKRDVLVLILYSNVY